MASRALDLVVRHRGREVASLRADADPHDPRELRELLVHAVEREGRTERDLGDYEMEIRYAGDRQLLTTFVAAGRH